MEVGVRIGRESNRHELIEPGCDPVRHGSFAVGDEADTKAPRQRASTLNGFPAHSKTVLLLFACPTPCTLRTRSYPLFNRNSNR
jgi:hypothetical protein